jgi:nicotinamide-nucleotide amidase
MHAAILSIGDELTLGQTLNTNSAWLADQLAGQAVVTREHRTVADDRARIATAIELLAHEHDLLIISGGLGPTTDDLTRQALGDVATPGEALVTDPVAVDHLKARFARRARPMPESNLIQAQRPSSMRFLPNPHGTAMGIAGRRGRCLIFALPGPPKELQPMFRDYVIPALALPRNGQALRTMAVHQYGLGESDAAERLGELMRRDRMPVVGTTVSHGIVTARIRAQGDPARIDALMEETAKRVEQAWHPYAYGRGNVTLAMAVGSLLREQTARLVTAESCTGGLLGTMVTEVAGSSDYYLGGWVTYSNELKIAELGVPPETLRGEGAVSAATAEAMVRGALAATVRVESGDHEESQRRGPLYSLAITGIAGPGGGSVERRVGTVYIGLGWNTCDGNGVLVRGFQFAGDREDVRDRSAKSALQMLRLHMLDSSSRWPMLWEAPPTAAARVGAAS